MVSHTNTHAANTSQDNLGSFHVSPHPTLRQLYNPGIPFLRVQCAELSARRANSNEFWGVAIPLPLSPRGCVDKHCVYLRVWRQSRTSDSYVSVRSFIVETYPIIT